MSVYSTLLDLLTAIEKWVVTDCVKERTTAATSRTWALTSLGFGKAITDTNVRAFVDSSALNKHFIEQFVNSDPTSKKTTVHTKVEIGFLYSFHKCVAARCSTRLNIYNDDLGQKHGRLMNNVGIGYYKYNNIKTTSG